MPVTMKNITHIFSVDDNQYALDYQNIFFCLLDDDTRVALECVLSDAIHESSSELVQTIKSLMKSGYFMSKYPDITVPNFEYDTLNISFAPVHDCNFACKYCYAKGGKGTQYYQMKYDENNIKKMLSCIYKGKYASYENYKFDFVSGGEPLLEFDILEYFLKTLRSYDSELDKKTTVLIVTNGALLTSEIIQKLDKYDVFLGISIDGPEDVHNRHRVYKNGSNTYKDVVNGISLLRSSKNISSKLKDAWAMSVITRSTGSLVDLMETCIGLGFKRMQMQLLREAYEHPLAFRKSDLSTLKNYYRELINHILSHAEQGDLCRIKMIANGNDSFGKFIGRLLLRTPVFYRCFAGKNKIAVTASGEIYPCDSFCGTSEYSMGFIDAQKENTDVTELFLNAHVNNRERCSKCWARNICGGDCFYDSYLVNGNIHDPNPIKCEMNRFFIENAVDLLIRLQKINHEYINHLAKVLHLQ